MVILIGYTLAAVSARHHCVCTEYLFELVPILLMSCPSPLGKAFSSLLQLVLPRA